MNFAGPGDQGAILIFNEIHAPRSGTINFSNWENHMSNKTEATFNGNTPAEMDAIHELTEARRRVDPAAKPGFIDLHHPNGTPKTVAEIQEEAADLNAIDAAYEPQPETIGDWAGHTPTPTIDAEIEKGQWEAQAEADLAAHKAAHIADGLRALVMESGENSRDHGFHDDWPQETTDGVLAFPTHEQQSEHFKTQIRRAIVEKIALQHEELSESLGEIRSGRDPLEIYFVDKKGLIGPAGKEYPEQVYQVLDGSDTPVPLLKPEGFLVEQADTVIRIADLVFLVNGREQFIKARAIKHEYNASREYKHGRKF